MTALFIITSTLFQRKTESGAARGERAVYGEKRFGRDCELYLPKDNTIRSGLEEGVGLECGITVVGI